MKGWQDRLLVEAEELRGRLIPLGQFLVEDEFMDLPRKDQILLIQQEAAMSNYLEILGRRIARLTDTSLLSGMEANRRLAVGDVTHDPTGGLIEP